MNIKSISAAAATAMAALSIATGIACAGATHDPGQPAATPFRPQDNRSYVERLAIREAVDREFEACLQYESSPAPCYELRREMLVASGVASATPTPTPMLLPTVTPTAAERVRQVAVFRDYITECRPGQRECLSICIGRPGNITPLECKTICEDAEPDIDLAALYPYTGTPEQKLLMREQQAWRERQCPARARVEYF